MQLTELKVKKTEEVLGTTADGDSFKFRVILENEQKRVTLVLDAKTDEFVPGQDVTVEITQAQQTLE